MGRAVISAVYTDSIIKGRIFQEFSALGRRGRLTKNRYRPFFPTSFTLAKRYNSKREAGVELMKTVYADVLFCVNFFIDFALLAVTARILKRRVGGLRLTLSAALGAAYSVAVFFPGLTLLATLVVKLLFSAVLTLAAFGARSAAGYFKALGIFYAVSFGFGGAVFGAHALIEPSGVMISGDAIYIDVDPLFLFLLIGGSYCAVWIFSRLLPKRSERHVRVLLRLGGRTAALNALYDSGNGLTEPISGAPVLIAEYAAVARLIPKPARPAFRGVPCPEAAEWGHGYRLIAARGVFGDALLPAFRPDGARVCAKDAEYETDGLFVAVVCRPLSSDGRYDSLAGDGLLRGVPAETPGKRSKGAEI